MNFDRIKTKLEKNYYRNLEVEFPEDFRLIFDNAILNYPPESSYHQNAKELKKLFEVKWESVKEKLAYEFSQVSSSSYLMGNKITLSTKNLGLGFVPRPLSPKSTLPEISQVSSSNLDRKVSLSTNLGLGLGLVSTPLSSERALHVATMKIRFSETIVKAKYKILMNSSSTNKADVMKRMEEEKLILEKRLEEEKLLLEKTLEEEKAKIEDETKASRLKLRQEARLAIEKTEEGAKFNDEDNRVQPEMLKQLCGSSYLSRSGWSVWLKKFGMCLKKDGDGCSRKEIEACYDLEDGAIVILEKDDDDDDCFRKEIEACYDLEEGEIV